MKAAAPVNSVPKKTRSNSSRPMVISAPIVGPTRLYMPPAMAPKTICKEMPKPASDSGFRYMRYCAVSAPASPASAAEMSVTFSFSRVTWMPMDAAASSSSAIAISALEDMDRSSSRQASSPTVQAASATHQKPALLNCMAAKAASGGAWFGVMPSEPPVYSRSAVTRMRTISPAAKVTSAK